MNNFNFYQFTRIKIRTKILNFFSWNWNQLQFSFPGKCLLNTRLFQSLISMWIHSNISNNLIDFLQYQPFSSTSPFIPPTSLSIKPFQIKLYVSTWLSTFPHNIKASSSNLYKFSLPPFRFINKCLDEKPFIDETYIKYATLDHQINFLCKSFFFLNTKFNLIISFHLILLQFFFCRFEGSSFCVVYLWSSSFISFSFYKFNLYL
jgi:hypothetical protein